MKIKTMLIAVSCTLITATSYAAGDLIVPEIKVPSSVIKKVSSPSVVEKSVISNESSQVNKSVQRKYKRKVKKKDVEVRFKPLIIDMEPGINQVLPISQGYLNRIVTPFEEPFVNTVSKATIEIHKNIIYVVSEEKTPVTLFITPDATDESVALSLTLAPKKIPPVEATLRFKSNDSSIMRFNTSKAKKWEEGAPYVSKIKDIMKSLALYDLPNGYSLGKPVNSQHSPYCMQKGMVFTFENGQYLKGHHFDVSVGVVKNASNIPLEVDEAGSCMNGSIAAVSSWPRVVLNPGERSEFIVVFRNDLKEKTYKKRNSVLSGGE